MRTHKISRAYFVLYKNDKTFCNKELKSILRLLPREREDENRERKRSLSILDQ